MSSSKLLNERIILYEKKQLLQYIGIKDIRKVKEILTESENVLELLNGQDNTYLPPPLIEAIKTGNQNLVKLLFKFGADVNEKSNSSLTPLMTACFRKDEQMMKLLIYNGAKYTERDIIKCSNFTETLPSKISEEFSAFKRDKQKDTFAILMRENPNLGWGTIKFR